MGYMTIWRKHALVREGERLTVYLDSEGKETAGIGHLVLPEDNLKLGDRISKGQSQKFFEHDTKKSVAISLEQAEEIGIEDDWFIAALISVNFQLGDFERVFTRSYPAIVHGDYDKAIKNLRRSKWYRQTPVRVEDFILALERAKALKSRPLAATRTVQGGSIAGAGVIASTLITEVTEKIEPLVKYSSQLETLFLVLALVGIAITIYARIDDRKAGHR